MSSSSTKPTPLNSTPEILLRKRRNADRTRLEKQELTREKQAKQKKLKSQKKNRFIRAETIVATTLATTREKERIKRMSILETKKAKNDVDRLPSDKDFILKITERPHKETETEAETQTVEEEDEDDNLIKEKIEYDGKDTLLFVIRVKGPTAVNLPHKVFKILSLLRLEELNTGVFVKLTKNVFPLLKLISPYIIIGTPSLNSIRSLIQKRSRILYTGAKGDEEPHSIVLNDNNIIEDKLGEQGIICMADIIHEIATLGENFQTCNFFLQPFKLNREVSGFSSLNKLRKIKQRENESKIRQFSNASTAPIIQVDIDSLIAKLN
ncbi:Rlp7p NDAI_0C02590 [Naumovozyma dairenensis CBS 421]|uniref:Ribosome biogenesis protein RLP7 n=1 Tax=Naumovozyma dairenensis (strain ATCC 10597 / BCRC 20456 / CBS 421 / NBRC 0211 / NRRL Y-12639) TaxID=1071378 RepID=G0W808_NAUDC|nr:hypothetical protein NDAI_0C02590 [Naumovozyma dairenensis CBS 421]CCD23919.1 hypothetical protein NDAI_0C02590 [Naumovozyma dairenensis CBS 421]